ncbi:unnamed protein product [Diatraea saccharalis]|uniref:Transmembrane protein 107 n=1 Tax=Diatraea saccharalis TaxID=40085 RepID=A0A9N9QV70_9NEOP|nr:unnamed protein product [Diatraea saccharalis]
MRGASTLIPARFLTLIGHLCVVVTLLWESKQSVRHCLPSQYHSNYIQIYHNRLIAGFAVSIAFILIELTTFILGLTMFSPTVSLISIGGHGAASIALTYFVIDGWLCDWFWPIFAACSVVPCLADLTIALLTLCSNKW